MSRTDLESVPGGGQVLLRYWASAAATAGVDSDVVEVARAVTLAELMTTARERHPSVRFRDVLGCCSVLVGDRPTHGDPAEVLVHPGERVEFLPPFAGG